MKSFLTRLLSGVVLVLITVGACWLGSWTLGFFVALIGYIGLDEYYKVFGLRIGRGLGWIGLIGATLWFVILQMVTESAVGDGVLLDPELKWLVLPVVFLLILGVYVFTFPKYDTGQVTAVFFGIVYIPVMLSFIYQTRMLNGGLYLVWLIFFCSWGCDTFAYLSGMLLGKHKLAPELSPKKSKEGAVGGVVGAAVLGGIYAALTGAVIWVYVLICAAGAIASQIGDLAASAVKRQHNIKDYGNLIPGHGGILDRFDSVIVTAPMIYILAILLT